MRAVKVQPQKTKVVTRNQSQSSVDGIEHNQILSLHNAVTYIPHHGHVGRMVHLFSALSF